MAETTEAPGSVSREVIENGMSSMIALAMLGHQAPPNIQRLMAQILDNVGDLVMLAACALDEGPECLARVETRVREGQTQFALLQAQEGEMYAGEVLRQLFSTQLKGEVS